MRLILVCLAALCSCNCIRNETVLKFLRSGNMMCLNTDFNDTDALAKVIRVSFVNGTVLVFNFELNYEWQHDQQHYVDFNSYTRQVVLRLLFEKTCKNDSSNDCTLSQLIVSTLRSADGEAAETVGKTDTIKFSHGRIPVRVNLNTTITDDGFYFEIAAQKDGDVYEDPVKHFRKNGYNYVPYQTTDIVRLEPLPKLKTKVCYPPPSDVCSPQLCLICPAGTIIQPLDSADNGGRFNNTHKCVECEPGNHSTEVNSGKCSVCKPGSFSERFSMSRCEKCPAGTSSDQAGTSECEECKLGKYSAEAGATECITCQPGWKTEKSRGAKTCIRCEVGTYSLGKTTQCRPCARNSVTPVWGAAECVHCQFGRLNYTHCMCAAGTRRFNETMCEVCEKGTYTPRDNMLECVECAGTVTHDNKCECPDFMELKGDVCVRVPCRPGQKKNLDGSCSPCPLGSYSKVEDSEQCLLCKPGTYQSREEQDKCEPCPKGTSQHLRGSKSCVPCQISTYQNNVGQPTCVHCHGTVNSLEHTCLEDVFECAAVTIEYPNIGSITWPRAENNEVVTSDCQYGGTAQRTCQENSWLSPVLLDCNSAVTAKVNKAIMKEHHDDYQDVEAIKMVVSEDITRFGPKDIQKVAEAIETISPENKEVAASKLETALHMTNYDTDLQHVLDTPTKDRIVLIVEDGVEYLVANGVSDLEKFNTDDISLSVNPKGSLSRRLDQDQMVSITQNSTFSTIVYHNSKLFDTRTSKADLITSEVLSVKLHGEEKEVKPGFSIDLTIKVLLDSTAECRWYDTDKSVWSTSGCYITSRSGDTMHCQCDHLTSFAAFTSLSKVPEGHKEAQSVISTLLFVLSIITLVFTLLVYIPIRSFRTRLIVQVELMEVVALILANITFLSLAHAEHQSRVCTGLVFGVQYLYLVTVSWSFVAALVFYRQIVTAIHTYGKRYDHTFKISCVLCWVLPLILPSFALIYSQKHGLNYLATMDGEFQCWIAETWKIYTFILPILIVVSVNAVIGVRVVIIMFRAAQTNADSKDDLWKIHKRHIKSILSLIAIFGISFLLSLFTYGPQAVAFQYLFIICTCSQGLFIFILFVPLRPEVHAEWKSILQSSARARLMSPDPRYSSRTSQATNSSIFTRNSNKIFNRSNSKSKIDRRDTAIERCVQS